MSPKHPLIFFGTPHFAVESLKLLVESQLFNDRCVVTQPDKKAGRGHRTIHSPVKEYALLHEIPCIQPLSISKTGVDFLESLPEAEVGVVVAFGQIFPDWLLKYPKRGCINVHSSILPRWRGAAPMQRAIMEGDLKTGVAIMQMERGLDSGPVYGTTEVALTDKVTFGALYQELATAGAKLLTELLPQIIAGTLSAVPQPDVGVTLAAKISREERLIKWGLPAQTILRHIHALSPAPAAYTLVSGKRVKIFEVELIADMEDSTPAGTISRSADGSMTVKAESGSLRILALQMEGAKQVSGKEFLNGRKELIARQFDF